MHRWALLWCESVADRGMRRQGTLLNSNSYSHTFYTTQPCSLVYPLTEVVSQQFLRTEVSFRADKQEGMWPEWHLVEYLLVRRESRSLGWRIFSAKCQLKSKGFLLCLMKNVIFAIMDYARILNYSMLFWLAFHDYLLHSIFYSYFFLE